LNRELINNGSYRYTIDNRFRGELNGYECIQSMKLFDSSQIKNKIYSPGLLKRLEDGLPYPASVNITSFGITDKILSNLHGEQKDLYQILCYEIAVRIALLNCIIYDNNKEENTNEKDIDKSIRKIGLYASSIIPTKFLPKLQHVDPRFKNIIHEFFYNE